MQAATNDEQGCRRPLDSVQGGAAAGRSPHQEHVQHVREEQSLRAAQGPPLKPPHKARNLEPCTPMAAALPFQPDSGGAQQGCTHRFPPDPVWQAQVGRLQPLTDDDIQVSIRRSLLPARLKVRTKDEAETKDPRGIRNTRSGQELRVAGAGAAEAQTVRAYSGAGALHTRPERCGRTSSKIAAEVLRRASVNM